MANSPSCSMEMFWKMLSIKILHVTLYYIAWKVSKYGVISEPNTGKYRPEITSCLDTFHAV